MIFRALRAIYYKGALRTNLTLARREGITIGEGTYFHGRPIVGKAPSSTISIGARCQIISSPRETALGVNHATVLRTLRPGATIAISDDVGISGGSICAAQSITIGAGTLVGANVTITDTDFHPVRHPARRYAKMPNPRPEDAVHIEENVFLGTGCVVLKGVRIGANSVVGAGVIVRKSVARDSIVT